MSEPGPDPTKFVDGTPVDLLLTEQAQDFPEAITSAPCSVCGQPIPMRISEYKEMIAMGAPVTHAEHTQVAAPVVKNYRAVVQVFEVADDGTTELVAATTAKATAPTLHAAFDGPLSEDLQGKWIHMAEHSAIGDLPPPPD